MISKRIVFVTSTKDPASQNMLSVLLDKSFSRRSYFPFFTKLDKSYDNHSIYRSSQIISFNDNTLELELLLYSSNRDLIHLNNFEDVVTGDLFLYLSKHSSSSGMHSFSVHSTGNWTKENLLGGEPEIICPTDARFQTLFLKQLFSSIDEFNSSATEPFDVVLECTHHGPTSKAPLLFVEIGSSLPEWSRKLNALFIIEQLLFSCYLYAKSFITLEYDSYPVCIGIGGPHYTPILTKYLLKKDILLGHVIPKYAALDIDVDLILSAIQKTPGTSQVLLDWKGLTKCKEHISKVINTIFLDSCHLTVIKIK